jgi:hypothetical protein
MRLGARRAFQQRRPDIAVSILQFVAECKAKRPELERTARRLHMAVKAGAPACELRDAVEAAEAAANTRVLPALPIANVPTRPILLVPTRPRAREWREAGRRGACRGSSESESEPPGDRDEHDDLGRAHAARACSVRHDWGADPRDACESRSVSGFVVLGGPPGPPGVAGPPDRRACTAGSKRSSRSGLCDEPPTRPSS